MRTLTDEQVRAAAEAVRDPEIPTATIGDLGVVERVSVTAGAIEVDLLPTFAGCPALDAIREDVETAVRALAGDAEVRVRFVMSPPWTTDRIRDAGKEALREYGIAAPGERVLVQLGKPQPVRCPYCGSERTREESAFGPTPCRSVRYCDACRNPFEGFKPKLRA